MKSTFIISLLNFFFLQAIGQVYSVGSSDGSDENTNIEQIYFVGNGDGSASNNLGTSGNEITLPVELSSFELNCKKDSVIVNFRTETETNNDFFIIESSKNGTNFDSICSVKGQGTSLVPKHYTRAIFRDNSEFYRLKQVDYDGSVSYSNIIRKICHDNPVVNLEIYPNPVQSELVLETFKDSISYSIYSNIGKAIIIDQQFSKKATINTTSWAKGIYIIKYGDGDNYNSKRIVIK